MDNLTLIIALTTLLAGLAVGVLIGRRSSAGVQKQLDAERELEEAKQQHQQYQSSVMEHFTDTAHLLNNLTHSYSEVHEHLARGASQLCEGETPIALPEHNPASQELPQELADISPPLDYAPKTSTNEPGMLNEKFGLGDSPPPPAGSEQSDKIGEVQ